MRAATIVDGRVELREHPDPAPGTGEILVRVRAAGVNRADLLPIGGLHPAPPGAPPDIPGPEIAGEVVARDATGPEGSCRATGSWAWWPVAGPDGAGSTPYDRFAEGAKPGKVVVVT